MPARRGDPAIVDVGELGELIHKKRLSERLTLRDVEDQLDHSLTASTISRLENGATPEIANVPILAGWLDIPLEMIGWPGQVRQKPAQLDTPTAVEVHLRADTKLPPGAADALARMFRLLYEDFASGDPPMAHPRRRSR